MANVEDTWKNSKDEKKCKTPWFQNPAKCKKGHTYIFKRFINGHETRQTYEGSKEEEFHGQHGKNLRKMTAHSFMVDNPITGKQYPMYHFEDNNDGCFRDVDSQRGGAKPRRTRKVTRRAKSRRNRK